MIARILKQTFHGFLQDRCMKTSASLAYFTLFSLPPLLVLITAIVGLVFDPEMVRQSIEGEFQKMIGPAAARQIAEMIANASQLETGTLALLIGLAALLFGATGVVVELQDALNTIWEVEPDPQLGGIRNFIRKRIASLAMVLGLAFVMMVSLALTTILTALGDSARQLLPAALSETFLIAANLTVTLGVLTVLFAAMFKILPDARLKWRDVWVGATGTAVFFTLGKTAIGIYLGSSQTASAYGSAGALVLVLLWVYYSALIFFLGAEFTEAWTRAHGREIEPSSAAVRLVEKKEIIRQRSEYHRHKKDRA